MSLAHAIYVAADPRRHYAENAADPVCIFCECVSVARQGDACSPECARLAAEGVEVIEACPYCLDPVEPGGKTCGQVECVSAHLAAMWDADTREDS